MTPPGWSIPLPTLDAALARRLEPAAAPPEARLRAVRILADAGLTVGVIITPIWPGLNDGWGALGGLMAAAKEAGASYVVGSALRIDDAVRTGLLQRLDGTWPDLAGLIRRRLAEPDEARRRYAALLDGRLRTLEQIHGFPITGASGGSRLYSPRPRPARQPSSVLSLDFESGRSRPLTRSG